MEVVSRLLVEASIGGLAWVFGAVSDLGALSSGMAVCPNGPEVIDQNRLRSSEHQKVYPKAFSAFSAVKCQGHLPQKAE